MAAGEQGQVVVAASTWAGLGQGRDGLALGPTQVKGKRALVEAWILRAAP
jgi:class 3 adenylate cyclase